VEFVVDPELCCNIFPQLDADPDPRAIRYLE